MFVSTYIAAISDAISTWWYSPLSIMLIIAASSCSITFSTFILGLYSTISTTISSTSIATLFIGLMRAFISVFLIGCFVVTGFAYF